MVTREDVENIALLSKLFVPEEELDGLTKSMQEIVEFADTINLNAYNTLPKYYMQAMVILNDSTARVKFPNQFAEELSSYNSFRKTLESLKSESRQFQSNSTFISNHESYFWFYTFRR